MITIPDEFVSPAELHALCGYVQAAAQRRWLDRNGVPYIPARDGSPRVRRDQLRAPDGEGVRLNLGALRGRRQAA